MNMRSSKIRCGGRGRSVGLGKFRIWVLSLPGSTRVQLHKMGPISAFIDRNYRHFNAASLKDAAEGYKRHLEQGGRMFVTLAGAMSTAELGLSLAEMIRQDKVHGICCTGANLEE